MNTVAGHGAGETASRMTDASPTFNLRDASSSLRRRRANPVLVGVLLALIISALSAWLSHTGPGNRMELMTVDWRLWFGGGPLGGSEIVVVHIDETTLDRYPDTGWPIPRSEYATFARGVLDAGAGVVAGNMTTSWRLS
jgi:CHASE2 domain-containing sensor protein